jgi:hypothetical protein
MGDFIKKYSDISDPIDTPGVLGTSTIYDGVLGYTTADEHAGVAGACDEGNGNGVYGRSANRNGIYGHSSAKFHSGVAGINDNQTNEAGPGIYGKSKGSGVLGESETWHGVAGISESTTGGAGVYGKGKIVGVIGESNGSYGVYAYNSNAESSTASLYAKKEGIGYAALFDGFVKIDKGTLIIGNKSIKNLLDELEDRQTNNMMKLIIEIEKQLKIELLQKYLSMKE